MREYLNDLLQTLRWRLLRTLALMVAFSLSEGAGVVLLLPILQVAGLDLTEQAQAGRLATTVAHLFQQIGIKPSLAVLLLAFVALMSARSFLSTIEMVSIYDAQQDFVLLLRRRLYAAISKADWLFLCRIRSADLTHAITGQIERVGEATVSLMMLAADLTLAAIYASLALELSTVMTVMVIGASGFLALALRKQTGSLRDKGVEVSNANERLYRAAIEHIQTLKAAKTYDAEQRNYDLFSRLGEELASSRRDTLKTRVRTGWWFESGSIVVLTSIIFVAVREIRLAPAEILILLLIFARVVPRIMAAHENYRSFISAIPSYSAVMDLEHRCVRAAEPRVSSGAMLPFRHRIALRSVSFAYQTGADSVLHNVDLSIQAGSVVALIGPSGAGKSTIGDLLMGLLTPDSGSIAIDGTELGDANRTSWRKQVGYLSQETFLFHDSIRANLLWACPAATDGEIEQALQRAAADEFVRRLHDGLDTVVGDRGTLLSHGERQRIALARALLRKPALLVLDEATNSLDPESEARVLGAIEQMRGELTVVLITHSLSAIRCADRVYLIEAGKVMDRASQDLKAAPGFH